MTAHRLGAPVRTQHGSAADDLPDTGAPPTLPDLAGSGLADRAVAFAVEVADRYAEPDAPGLPTSEPWWHQSLAHGAPGIVLLHLELAAAGVRDPQRAHRWLAASMRKPITATLSSGPFYGAPALTRVVHAAALEPNHYQAARSRLTRRVNADTLERVRNAHRRIDAQLRPSLSEFDSIRGLAGLGAYLLHHDLHQGAYTRDVAGRRGGTALRAVLGYLERLTHPIHNPGDTHDSADTGAHPAEGRPLPGWWTPVGPTGRVEDDFPGGHANCGLAHGIAGPLAVLALALRRGIVVDGHYEAINRIRDWLHAWHTASPAGDRWPYLVTRDDRPGAPAAHSGAHRRPSWCYGTAGIARALQLAALALHDNTAQHRAEQALLGALTDPDQQALIGDGSLCHGHAGLLRIAHHAATDSATQATASTNPSTTDITTGTTTRDITTQLRHAAAGALGRTLVHRDRGGVGFLQGATGAALAALAAVHEPVTAWDTCLLIA